MSTETTPAVTCGRCGEHKHRAELLLKSNELLRSQRDEWERAHDYLISDGYAWVAEVEMALDTEIHDNETYADCLERLLEELRDLRKTAAGRGEGLTARAPSVGVAL